MHFTYLVPQSAVGFEYQGKTEKHASQKGKMQGRPTVTGVTGCQEDSASVSVGVTWCSDSASPSPACEALASAVVMVPPTWLQKPPSLPLSRIFPAKLML